MALDLPREVFDYEAFCDGLNADNVVERCRKALACADAYLHGRFRAGDSAGELIRMRSLFVDTLVGELWDRCNWDPAELELVAVGGYGRGELHPHSDVDLLVLLGDNWEQRQSQLETYLRLLMDTGLHIGHSVRTVDECVSSAAEDITVVTNLMEARLLRGDGSMLAAVAERTAPSEMWPSDEFFRAKMKEQTLRHHKFADTEYNLEPNVKGSPGGLRDLQVLLWIARRHFGPRSLQELAEGHFLTRDELDVLVRGREFMWRVRYALHMLTDREEDRLLFDHQRQLAALWGFKDGDTLAVEQFMHDYYRWALALGRLNDLLIQNFDQAILRAGTADRIVLVDEHFQTRNGYVEARHEDLFLRRPAALLEVFLLCANHKEVVDIAAPTVRQIREHCHLIDDDFRRDPHNHRTFLAILRAPYNMTRQLRCMSRFGVLGAYLPEFGRIVGQMQHDLFHTYTVDAHTLEVIKNMRLFTRAESEERFPVTCRVARRLQKVELLYISGLFHDIGKGRGGDHSELGAVDAERFCREHDLSARDTELVVWLVRNHLTMSAVSQRKDLSDPDVIQRFAEHVGNQRRLNYLFCLTVADITGTNPTLWNAWRGSLLRQLYTETTRALRRGLENPVDKQAFIADTRRKATELLEYRGFTPEELKELWKQRGDDYFLRERPEDIAWQTEAIAGHRDRETPLVLVRNSTESSVANTTQIFIHARSGTYLFPRICAELEHLHLSIHDARIYDADDGMSLDTFFVLGSDGSSIAEDSDRLRDISQRLTDSLSDHGTVTPLARRRTPRQMKSFPIPTETRMTVDDNRNLSILEVSAPDRPGLLARIARIFVDHGVELQAAKIQTLGERVEDVFFLTDANQLPITDEALAEGIQRAIREELDEAAA